MSLAALAGTGGVMILVRTITTAAMTAGMTPGVALDVTVMTTHGATAATATTTAASIRVQHDVSQLLPVLSIEYNFAFPTHIIFRVLRGSALEANLRRFAVQWP